MSDQKPDEEGRSRFDDFAEAVAHIYGKSYAFLIAMLIVLVWAVAGPAMQFKDTWHLIINTPTTIVTFFGVFLIQNQQWRDGRALHKKINAIADVLGDYFDGQPGMERHVRELKKAVGLEEREGS